MQTPIAAQGLAPAPDPSQLGRFADSQWDREIIPALERYIAIPAKSPMFDAQWREHGHVDQVVREAAAWVACLPAS